MIQPAQSHMPSTQSSHFNPAQSDRSVCVLKHLSALFHLPEEHSEIVAVTHQSLSTALGREAKMLNAL